MVLIFSPETGLDKNLGLKEKLHNRIQEIHDTIGEDSAILDQTEQLNEDAMYAIYEKKGGQLSLFEDQEDELIDLNEAEEIMRQLKSERPEEYQRIAELRDGIRTGKPSTGKGLYVFCQAGRYQQLFQLDEKGSIVSRDIPRILGAIKCDWNLEGQKLPEGYNAGIMKVKRLFTEEVKHRQTEREHSLSLSHGQRYILRELRVLFENTRDDELKGQINILERAFRSTPTQAVKQELNKLRHNSCAGENLIKSLTDIYYKHNMKEWLERRSIRAEEQDIPRIICSEALL